MSWSLSAAKTVTGSSDLVCAIDFRYIAKAAATVSNRQAAVAAVMCLNQVYTGIEDSGHLDFRAAAWPQPETTLIEKILSNLPDNLRSKKDACPSVMRSSGIGMLEGKSAARSKPAFSARKPIPARPSERSSQNRSSIPATAASSRKTAKIFHG
jgi:hypothetical protein